MSTQYISHDIRIEQLNIIQRSSSFEGLRVICEWSLSNQVICKDDQELELFGEEAVVAYFDIHQKEPRKGMKIMVFMANDASHEIHST
jgi:hypothetical protein